MEKIYALDDFEYEKLIELEAEAWEKYNGYNERTAFRKCFQFCSRRDITEQEFWDWVND